MRLDVVFLPRDLEPSQLNGRVVVVFDVLRATTSMTAALAADVREIRVFADTASALEASRQFTGPKLLSGEEHTLPPPGFDLGNSPRAYSRKLHAGRTMFMSTTNGTRAIYAAKGAAAMYMGALVNASAVADILSGLQMDITLLCSGTSGKISIEDILGAGAVIDALQQRETIEADGDAVHVARRLFRAEKSDLAAVLHESAGGQNITRVGLAPDIDFAARLDSFKMVGVATGDPPIVRMVSSA